MEAFAEIADLGPIWLLLLPLNITEFTRNAEAFTHILMKRRRIHEEGRADDNPGYRQYIKRLARIFFLTR